jgi:uncharacterized membrane protein YsdA (DUF1294 family)/cold shock CspA family protein
VAEQRVEGTLTSWDDARGFGFLSPASGRGRVFVHITAFGRGTPRPRVGEAYAYAVDRHGDRRPQAVRVSRTGTTWSPPKPRSPRPSRRGRAAVAAALVASAALVAVALTTGGPGSSAGAPGTVSARWWAVGLLVALNIGTAVAYAVDKRAARRGTRRVPERTLLVCGLVGGWPGAVLAQQLLRHKTGKPAFRRAFALTVAAHLAVVALGGVGVGALSG